MGRVAARKPLLSHHNGVKRLARAEERKHWTAAGRQNVLCTDKSAADILSFRRLPYFERLFHII